MGWHASASTNVLVSFGVVVLPLLEGGGCCSCALGVGGCPCDFGDGWVSGDVVNASIGGSGDCPWFL